MIARAAVPLPQGLKAAAMGAMGNGSPMTPGMGVSLVFVRVPP